jgi:hypothetical protein
METDNNPKQMRPEKQGDHPLQSAARRCIFVTRSISANSCCLAELLSMPEFLRLLAQKFNGLKPGNSYRLYFVRANPVACWT